MPSRRAVVMTRQAISPRLAIRILEKHQTAPTFGLRLSQKRLHAFERFLRRALGGDVLADQAGRLVIVRPRVEHR